MIRRSAPFVITILFLYASTASSHRHHRSDSSDSDNCYRKIDRELGAKLSPKASIVHYSSAAPRWSELDAPRPGTIVNVAEENDVVETVKYCIENNLDFLAQSGGHAWANTFDIGKKDVVIHLRALNKVTVTQDKDKIILGGGALVSEMVDAAYANQVQMVTPTCNCVGIMGAILGGGFGRLMGYHGFAVDSLLSVNLVTADGELITVSADSHPDLWWAIRGAGANFGIVTSAVLKAHQPVNNNEAWMADLIFSPDKLEAVVQILADFNYTPETFPILIFTAAPPDATPTLFLNLWYAGSEAEGKAAHKALYDLGPISSTSTMTPYNRFNAVDDVFCDKGGRKPGYNVLLKKLDPETMRQVWNEWTSFLEIDPSFSRTTMMFGGYDPAASRQFDSAFPHRSANFLALLTQSYDDPRFDATAEKSGRKFQDLLNENSGFDELHCYINYSHGDEDLTAIYGDSLPRLKELKKKWDRHGRFSQYFPIPRS